MNKPQNFNFDTSKQAKKKEYFSGANAKVYFGDVWIDQIHSIQFSMQEQVTPIYGFNSYKFDKIARGTRLVSGMFSVNFTESGYLQTILERVSSSMNETQGSSLSNSQVNSLRREVINQSSGKTIQNLLSMEEGDSYDEYIASLKDSFWGAGQTSKNTVVSGNLSKEYDSFYYPNAEGLNTENPLKEHGFNILIDYSPDANKRDFEDCIRNANKNGSLYQTFRSIMGVHITGESQEVSANGQVLTQNYSFIARDLDGDVTELSMKHNYRNNERESEIPRVFATKAVAKVAGGSHAHGDQITMLD